MTDTQTKSSFKATLRNLAIITTLVVAGIGTIATVTTIGFDAKPEIAASAQVAELSPQATEQAKAEKAVRAYTKEVKATLAAATPETTDAVFQALLTESKAKAPGTPKLTGMPARYNIEMKVAADPTNNLKPVYYAIDVWEDGSELIAKKNNQPELKV